MNAATDRESVRAAQQRRDDIADLRRLQDVLFYEFGPPPPYERNKPKDVLEEQGELAKRWFRILRDIIDRFERDNTSAHVCQRETSNA